MLIGHNHKLNKIKKIRQRKSFWNVTEIKIKIVSILKFVYLQSVNADGTKFCSYFAAPSVIKNLIFFTF